ncbi:COG2426 family protein [Desulfitibacter alkalitolerans]|uniref:COG2426 family protein n=1 Tax=Desulfitibacter alkalitolerans TaxID=264641 RepID=UPI0006891404|nr:small multi-drug export protein [Desulfitibacter alkalitolerans]
MGQKMLDILKDLPIEAQVMILSAVPVTELRATIPIAIALGMEPMTALFYALLGNFIPVIPLLLWLPLVINTLNKYDHSKRLVQWVLSRTRAKSAKLQKYEALGLMLIVSVPLPLTGIWSGSIAAFLFGIPFKMALPAITLGMIIAGILVTLASMGFYTVVELMGIPMAVVLIGALAIVYFIYKKR